MAWGRAGWAGLTDTGLLPWFVGKGELLEAALESDVGTARRAVMQASTVDGDSATNWGLISHPKRASRLAKGLRAVATCKCCTQDNKQSLTGLHCSLGTVIVD